MRKSFKGEHVLITGGSEGIGLGLARLFVADGAKVTLLARSTQKLQEAQEELKEVEPNGVVNVVSADVGDGHRLRAILDFVEASYGVIDVAVCNAGRGCAKLLVNQTIEEAQEVMQVNYFGCYNTTHALIPRMIERGSGHISFVSSMIYASPMAGFTSYCPTKAAVRHFADALRSELVGTGVTVSVAYPPDTRTPGLEKENEEKASVVHELFQSTGEKVHDVTVVAKCLFRGLQRGQYHLPTPVLLHRLALSMVSGTSPRTYWTIIEILLAPLLVVIGVAVRTLQDRVVREWGRSKPLTQAPAFSVATVQPSKAQRPEAVTPKSNV